MRGVGPWLGGVLNLKVGEGYIRPRPCERARRLGGLRGGEGHGTLPGRTVGDSYRSEGKSGHRRWGRGVTPATVDGKGET